MQRHGHSLYLTEGEMKKIKEIFGGKDAKAHNVLMHVISERGYEFFEKSPRVTMTVHLIEDLHKLGYEITKKK